MSKKTLKEIETPQGDRMKLVVSGDIYHVVGWTGGRLKKSTKSLRRAKAIYKENVQEYFACRMENTHG